MLHDPAEIDDLVQLAARHGVPPELALLPVPPDGERLLIADSHDVTGFNDDGFSSRYSFLHRTPRGWVLFDHRGPGVIRLIRTIGFRGRLQLFLDDDPDCGGPAVDVPFSEAHAGHCPGFPAHLVADMAKGHGSAWCYVPFAFEKRCAVVAAGEPEEGPHFYTILSHVFAPGSFPTAAARARHPDIMVGWSPPPEGRGAAGAAGGSATLPAFGRQVLHEADGPGMVCGLFIRTGYRDPETLARVFLRATWDLPSQPPTTPGWESGAPLDVDAPLGLFFATGYSGDGELGAYAVDHGTLGRQEIRLGRARPAGVGVGELLDGTLYCRFPMPYWSRARLEIVNTSSRPSAPISWHISVRDNPYPPGCGHFRAVYHREDGTLDHRDYIVAEFRGSGTYAGCVMRMSSRKDPVRGGFQRGYLEGDARLYLDDARCFLSASTGTEEYFNWGWYDMLPHDSLFAFPTHGYTEHARDNADHTTMYRFHHPDRVPFYRSFRFELEHGPCGDWPSDYESVAFLYHRGQCLLPVTDVVEPGQERSARSHEYRTAGAVRKEHRTLVHEGDAQVRLATRRRETGEDAAELEGLSRTVQEFRQECSFTVAVDPANRGIRLRRTSDGDRPKAEASAESRSSADAASPAAGPAPSVPAQVAVVSVDGIEVGTWQVPSRISRPCWMEDEFDVDARFTAGRERLLITLRCAAGSAWRAASYIVFCLREASP